MYCKKKKNTHYETFMVRAYNFMATFCRCSKKLIFQSVSIWMGRAYYKIDNSE